MHKNDMDISTTHLMRLSSNLHL